MAFCANKTAVRDSQKQASHLWDSQKQAQNTTVPLCKQGLNKYQITYFPYYMSTMDPTFFQYSTYFFFLYILVYGPNI